MKLLIPFRLLKTSMLLPERQRSTTSPEYAVTTVTNNVSENSTNVQKFAWFVSSKMFIEGAAIPDAMESTVSMRDSTLTAHF